MHVCRKNVVPLHRKILLIWFNFKRFNTILNRKILLNLIRKIKNLTDQFQPVFVFALATLNSYILFLHCNFTTCYTVLYLIPESSITIDIAERELVCFVHLCHHPGPSSPSCFLGLFSFGVITVHIFSFHVWPFVSMLQVTWIKQYHS